MLRVYTKTTCSVIDHTLPLLAMVQAFLHDVQWSFDAGDGALQLPSRVVQFLTGRHQPLHLYGNLEPKVESV